MSTYENTSAVSMIAGDDLKGKIYGLLKLENDGGIAKVILTTAATDVAIGVLGMNPDSAVDSDGTTVPVVLLSGKTLMRAGGAITAGQLLVADSVTPGNVVGLTGIGALVADSMAVGVALESAVSGDVFSVFAMPLTSTTET